MIKKQTLIIGAAAVLLLSGCTKSNIVSGGKAEPVFETQEGIVLDWGQIGEDLDVQFVDSGDYPQAVSIGYSVDPEKKTLELNLMVKEGTTPEEAVEYAGKVIRAVGDEASTQDFSYERSTEETYGEIFDEYTLSITVLPEGTQASENLWLVDMTVPAGSNEKIVPIEGAKAMETLDAEAIEKAVQEAEEAEDETEEQE